MPIFTLFLLTVTPSGLQLIPLAFKVTTKKVVRMMSNNNYLEHTLPLFKLTKILELEDLT